MKCNSCGMDVSSDFAYALKINKCPKCGGEILSPRLSILGLLKTLLDEPGAEKVTNLIVDNYGFEITVTGDEMRLVVEEKKQAPMKMANQTTSAEPQSSVVTAEGVLLEQMDKGKAKDMLQKMREEALRDRDGSRGFCLTTSRPCIRHAKSFLPIRRRANYLIVTGG